MSTRRITSNIQLNKTTTSAVKGKKGLANLINRVLNDGSDPLDTNSFIRDQLSFYVKTALSLSNILPRDSRLPITVKLTGENSYVNLGTAFQEGIEIGVAHQRPKHGEKELEERLVCQYGYLEHELSHLRYADPDIWNKLIEFTGLENGRPTADPDIYDLDNIGLLKHIVNILGDGHDETRFMMQNRRQFLKTIVAKDEILGNYKYNADMAEESGQGQLGHLIGNMLMHALPNKATYQIDDKYMTDETKKIFDEIIPYIDASIEGTYDDIFENSKKIYLIMQRENLLPQKSQEQKELEQMLQQLAKDNPDVFQQMLKKGQQAPGSGQPQKGQGVGTGSGMTITLPNSRSDEVPKNSDDDSSGSGGSQGEKDKDKKEKGKGQGSSSGEKGEESGDKKEQGDGNGAGDKKDKDGEKGEGGDQGDKSDQQSGQSQSSAGNSSSKGGQGSNSGSASSGTPRFVEKGEAEAARKEAQKSAQTQTSSANKKMNQLAQNNLENEQMKQYSGTRVETPTIKVEHLKKNLELVRESSKEIEEMKRLLKNRLRLGSAPKRVKRQRTGRLDRRGFVRQDETESELIFERKLTLPSPKARIYMIGDMSGSMGRDQIREQAKAMTISAEAAKSLSIPIEVSYYSAAYNSSGIYMAKTFNQKNGVISLGLDRGTIPGGGTPTAKAIESAAARMVEDGFTSPEEQKIFYVLTDGEPDNDKAVKDKILELGKKYRGRVKVIGVFMKTHPSHRPPERFFNSFDTPYSDAVVVDGINKVPEEFTKVLVDIMKKRKFS